MITPRQFLGLLACAVPAALSAQVYIAYGVPAGQVSNQFIPNPLGMDFNVVSPIEVISLGVFDSAQDGLNFSHVVRIYDRATQASVVDATIPSGTAATLIGGSRFVPLATPFFLPAGFQGSIVAEINVVDGNGNTNGGGGVSAPDTGGGAIDFVGGGRVSDLGPGVYPLRLDGGPVNRYLAGTFSFTPVPEPAAGAAVAGAGALGFVLWRRRRGFGRGQGVRRSKHWLACRWIADEL